MVTVKCSVRTAGGKVASGFGSIPFNHTFSFPSQKMTNETKNDAMKALAAELAKVTGSHQEFGHPIEEFAGKHERNNVPVQVLMPGGQLGKDRIASVTLARTDGQLIPAQWTGPGLASSADDEFVAIEMQQEETNRVQDDRPAARCC